MQPFCCRRVLGVALVPLVLATALPLVALASRGEAISGDHTNANPHQSEFVFGREGGSIRPLTVTIYDDGTVIVNGVQKNLHPRLSQDTLDGLMKLAQAEGFFRMPSRMTGQGLPDVAGRFISIHTHRGTTTVRVRYVRNVAFDQLYAVLMAVAGAGP
jgi:hypothetical protein